MKLTFVETVPKRRRGRHDLQDMIEEFVRSNRKVAKIDFNESDYKSPEICRSCICAAVKRSKALVTVAKRGDDVYLIKKEV